MAGEVGGGITDWTTTLMTAITRVAMRAMNRPLDEAGPIGG
jgi:hypothetical protein